MGALRGAVRGRSTLVLMPKSLKYWQNVTLALYPETGFHFRIASVDEANLQGVSQRPPQRAGVR